MTEYIVHIEWERVAGEATDAETWKQEHVWEGEWLQDGM